MQYLLITVWVIFRNGCDAMVWLRILCAIPYGQVSASPGRVFLPHPSVQVLFGTHVADDVHPHWHGAAVFLPQPLVAQAQGHAGGWVPPSIFVN